MQMLGGRGDGGGGYERSRPQRQEPRQQSAPSRQPAPVEDFPDDDIPF